MAAIPRIFTLLGIGGGGVQSFSTLSLTGGVASTSTTTGTLIVTGGVGVSGNIHVGGNLNVGVGGTGVLNLGDAQLSKASGSAFSFNSGVTSTGTITAGGPVIVKNYTVATLPSAASNQYGHAFVTDATLTAITGLGLSPTGGGSNKVPVYSDGTSWLML